MTRLGVLGVTDNEEDGEEVMATDEEGDEEENVPAESVEGGRGHGTGGGRRACVATTGTGTGTDT